MGSNFIAFVHNSKKEGQVNEPMTEQTTGTTKQFIMNVLNGLSLAILIALIPSALLGELTKAILPYFPSLQFILDATTIAMRLLPAIIGLAVAMQFGRSTLEAGTIAIATHVGSGAVRIEEGTFLMAGIGDVITAGVTAGLATFFVIKLAPRLKTYTVVVLPMTVIVVAGGIGTFLLTYISQITTSVGSIIMTLTDLQPILMGILIAMAFSLIIVSPISTVGIATAISLSGVAAGAANLGVVAAGFGLAIAGWQANATGTSIAHFLGSPKIQMANFIRRPVMMLPVLANAAILGALAGILRIEGTPISAGFGVSGLIGPINALHLMPGGFALFNVLLVIVLFGIIPVALGIFFYRLFARTSLVASEHYRLDFD